MHAPTATPLVRSAPPRSRITNPGALLALHPELRIDQDIYNINVTANFGTTLTASETWQQIATHDGAQKPVHLYFHLPLCSYVCRFCNYVKRQAPTGAKLDDALDHWTGLLIEESQRYLRGAPWLSAARVESLFLGGGTASLLRPRHLARIMRHVQDNYSVIPGCEATLEGNPDNFLADEVSDAIEIGFNRFSVGIQSLDSKVNAFAGRGHDRQMSLKSIEKLSMGGRPFNADLMFGLPYQTADSVRDDVSLLVSMGVPTITIYRLRNADRHKMGIGNQAAWNNDKIRQRLHDQNLFPTLESTYAMREAMVDVLLDANYEPSPCGWWSAPGSYPDGNIPQVSRNKWQNYDTMIGFGPGAYGWLAGIRPDPIQTHNIADISAHARHVESQSTAPLASGRRLTGAEAVATALGFAFKSNQPISVQRFARIYGVNLLSDEPYAGVIEDLMAKGLVEPVNGSSEYLKPTLDGETLHEEIITTHIHGRIGGVVGAVCRR